MNTETFLNEVLFPIVRRLGTAFSGWLVGSGVASGVAEDIAVGAVAAVLLAIELIASHYSKKKVR